jgi:CBS domain containing-hemolysin-like protein
MGARSAPCPADRTWWAPIVIAGLIALGAVLLLANSVFVCAEFALIAARRSRLQQLATTGDLLAAAAITHARRLPTTLAALQVGISAASIGLGFTLEATVEAVVRPVVGHVPPPTTVAFDALATVIALAIVSGAHTLFGEMVPKNLAIAAPETSARWLSLPTSATVWLATPFVSLLWRSTSLLLRLMRVESRSEIEVAGSADEIRSILDVSRTEGLIRDYDERLLKRILAFAQMRLSQAMVPWSEVVAATETSSAADLERAFAKTGRGRLPLQAAVDRRIIGYVKSCDLGQIHSHRRNEPIQGRLIRDVVYVDASARVVSALDLMRRAGRHFAVVTAPNGEHVGIVTMRRVIELLITDPGQPDAGLIE